MRKRGINKGILVLIIMILGHYSIPSAYGSGYAIYTQGATSTGQAAATIAHTDDPSAIFFNPALINELDKTQVMIGTTFLIPSREFTSQYTGNTQNGDNGVFFPSTIYITHKFDDNWSAGLGVFNPFGLGAKWPTTWEGRYIATDSELSTYNINPVVSYQAAPWISVAAGLDVVFLDTTLERNIYLAPFGLPDGAEKFKGSGTGVGYNLGLLLKPVKDVSIGASYRSMIKIGASGDTTFDLPVPQLAALFPNTGGSVGIVLPQQLQFGVCYKGFYPFTVEIGGRWEGWSSVKQLQFTFDQPIAGSNVYTSQRDWKNTWSEDIGFKYQLNDTVALLAGYLHQGNPIPDQTYDPVVPDANANLVTIGTDLKFGDFKIGLAYGYQWFSTRTKNNAVDDNPNDGIVNPVTSANGTYKSSLNMVAVSLTYKF